MSLCNWSCICLLSGLLVIGWPLQGNCETSKDEASPVKAKECRQHIEKALEQYWEQKDSPDDINTESEYLTRNLKENSYEDEKESKSRLYQNHEINLKEVNSEEDDDDDDDDEEETDDVENANEGYEREEEEEEEDDNESNDDDDKDKKEQRSDENNEDENEDNGNDEDDNDSSNIDSEIENNISGNYKKAIETSEQSFSDNAEEADNEDHDNDDKEVSDNEEDENEDENNSDEDDGEDEEKNNTSDDDADDEEEEEEEDEEQSANDEDLNEEDTEGDEVSDEDDNVNQEETNSNAFPAEGSSKSDVVSEGQIKTDQAGIEEDMYETSASIPKPETRREQLSTSDAVGTEETEKQESGRDPTEREDDDSIENMFEEEEEEDEEAGSTYRSREHIDVILGLDEIGTGAEKEEEKLAQSVFRDIKKIETTNIKPMEHLYRYADSTTRLLGDAEIFSKPMLLFLGPWSTGKSSIINYILGLERTPNALKIGTGITDVDFTLLTYGSQHRTISGTELSADWHYAGVQKFGQGFLDHFRSIHIPHALLQKVTIIDTPGIVEGKKNTERGYSLSDAFQWFIDRADAIYVVLDPPKVDIGSELGSVIEQLQGRDVRFLLNKADTIRRSDLMRVVGQLFWNLSPLMSGTEAPLIYAVSLTSHPYHPSAPAKFLADQEKNFFYDMKETLEKRVENKILYARKHAVRVRNHAKMVDCYLASYFRHKSIFSSKRNVAKLITENPLDYNIYDGLSSMTNVSRHDLPNPLRYREFFKLHPLYDFKPLSSTCSYFRGCPIDKLDIAIAKDFPELLAKYKDAKRALLEGMGKVR